MKPGEEGLIHVDHAEAEDEDFVEVIDLDQELGDPEDWEDESVLEQDSEERKKPIFLPIEDIPTISPEIVFTKHEGSVFSVSLDHISGRTVISGGEDDKAYIWNSDDGSMLFPCEGHKDSVVQVGISHDGVFAFTGDMAGLIKVWRVIDGEELWSTETSDLKVAKWHPGAHVLFAGCEDGSFYMWQVPQGQCKYHQCSHSISALEVLPEGKKIALAYGEGTVVVFDLKNWKIIHSYHTRADLAGEVITMDINMEGTLVACGNVTGSVILCHTLNGKVLWENRDSDFGGSEEAERAIECVAFSKSRPWLAVGGLNGTFCIYDLTTLTKRNSGFHENLKSISKLIWHPNDEGLLLSHLNGAISLWDARAATLSKVFFGDQEEILDFVVSVDGQKLVSASDDGTVCCFQI